MRLKIPYLNTSLETDLLAALLLTPLWWILGFNIFIYQLVAYGVFFRLLIKLGKLGQPLKIPAPALWLSIFLLSYLASMVINLPNYPTQRILSSVNHYSILVMGFFLVLTVYHLDPAGIVTRFFKICWILSGFTGALAVLSLTLWFRGYKNLETSSLLAHFFPSMLTYPFFHLFSMIRFTSTDWLFFRLPRLSIYSAASTATGGFLVLILPLAIAYFQLKKKGRWAHYSMLALSLTALLFSLSRMAVCAFFASFAFVWFLEKRNKFMLSLALLVLVFFASGRIYDGLIWLLNVRHESTVGRLSLYSDALRVVAQENLLMGVGVRPRDEFTLMAVGSHSTYVGVLLVTGLLGLSFFLLFQGTTFMTWLGQKGRLQDQTQRIIWKYLGISYIGASIWFLTDTLETFPFIAYVYFLIVACILSFSRFLDTASKI